MSKTRKQELSLFIDGKGRRRFNPLCGKCQHSCKQSYRVTVVECPKYLSKRSKCIVSGWKSPIFRAVLNVKSAGIHLYHYPWISIFVSIRGVSKLIFSMW